MSFIYNKPLSIEQVFAKFNTNGGEEIDEHEANNAKNIKIFQGFKVEKDMKFEDFERENLEVYRQYEELATENWAKSVLKNKYSTDTDKVIAEKLLQEIADNTLKRAEEQASADVKSPKPNFGID